MIIYRGDLKEFVIGNPADLYEAMGQFVYYDNIELMVNSFGNIAILEQQPRNRDLPADDETNPTSRWYIGYYDMATGKLAFKVGVRMTDDNCTIPGYPAQSPFDKNRSEVRYTAGEGSEMYIVSLQFKDVNYQHVKEAQATSEPAS